MKILVKVGIFAVALTAIAAVMREAILLTIFSATREFFYAGQALAAAILMLALGVALRKRVRKSITLGSSLFFSVLAATVLLFDAGFQEGYVPRMEISLPSWHFTAFTWAGMSFGIIPLLLLIKKEPNQSAHPTLANERG